MIQAILLDLPLLTAATDDGIADFGAYEEQAYDTFRRYRDQLVDINRRLSCNPAITVQLRIPLTERLFNHLHLFWSQKPYSQLRMLRTIVMALLAGRRQRQIPELITVLDDIQIEHSYQLREARDNEGKKQPALTFPQALSQELCEAWIETLGACIFACGMTAPQISLEPLAGVWITSDRRLPATVYIRRIFCLSPGQEPEDAEVSVLAQPDAWMWERWLRQMLWDDKRLPFGPIGYLPPEQWRLGDRPSRYGWRDRFGAVWKWAPRAGTERNPFAGHWDIQFPNPSIKHQWVQWIEKCTGWQINTRPTAINHINIEPDGTITDKTFTYTTVTNDA
jgi:hypothetical protein